jgi:hypothetical protein
MKYVCRSTGVGDHGAEGIKIWKEQHNCNNVCEYFGLRRFAKADEEESDGEVEK